MNSLVGYSSGSSSDDETDEILTIASRKRRADDEAQEESRSTKLPKQDDREDKTDKIPQNSLPLPGAIANMFESGHTDSARDDPQQHGGRIRSFPHVEGNWASYVYIPVSTDERLREFVNQLLFCLAPLNFKPMDDFHISLSRTVSIRHHWIQPLTESLKHCFQQLDSCLCDITSIKMFTNDEKTRTFVSLEVNTEDTNLLDYTAAVDSCFQEFSLPAFYKNPSFHISLVWTVGDVISKVPELIRKKLQTLTREFLSTHTDLSVVPVNKVFLKTGNKSFVFQLHNVDD